MPKGSTSKALRGRYCSSCAFMAHTRSPYSLLLLLLLLLLLFVSHLLIAENQSVVTRRAPITLEWNTSGRNKTIVVITYRVQCTRHTYWHRTPPAAAAFQEKKQKWVTDANIPGTVTYTNTNTDSSHPQPTPAQCNQSINQSTNQCLYDHGGVSLHHVVHMRIPLACCLLSCVVDLFLLFFSSFPFSISIWTAFVSSCLFLAGSMLSPRFRFLLRLV